jgi:chromate transport protein ChrA
MVTAIGAIRGHGFVGGLLAFLCFQFPGAIVMILAALASDMLDSYLQVYSLSLSLSLSLYSKSFVITSSLTRINESLLLICIDTVLIFCNV